MNDKDLDLKLLRGSPIRIIDLGELHPLTLDEIAEIGELKYNQYLSAILFEQEPLIIEGKKLTKFETLMVYCFRDETFRNVFIEAINTLFKEEIHLHASGFFYFGEIDEGRILTQDHYLSIKTILKKQNFFKDEEEEYKPANEKVADFIEKMKKVKEKIKQQNQDEGLNLSDIVSIVSSYSSNLNITTIWKLTVYQLYTLYIRLMMKDNYESQFQLMLQGADIKSSDIKHWATKLNK